MNNVSVAEAMAGELRTLLEEKGFLQAFLRAENPVIQSVSLFFWQTVETLFERALHPSPYPVVIALTGASGSGKSFVRQVLMEALATFIQVGSLMQDNYYRDFEMDFPHLPLARFYDEIDLDDPAHIRFAKLIEDITYIKTLSLGRTHALPRLIFGTPTSKPTIEDPGMPFTVTPLIITEGIHAFQQPALSALYDLKIYVDIDEDIRRERWLARNRQENRGTTDNMWNTTVECLNRYILPARPQADVVLNNNGSPEHMAVFVREFVGVVVTLIRDYRRKYSR